jgi:undecaprenyl diphosphate synthase
VAADSHAHRASTSHASAAHDQAALDSCREQAANTQHRQDTSGTHATAENAKLPRHVAIIPDGSRRWAARRGLAAAAGHRRGVRALRAAVQRCADIGIPELTVFAFSAENWGREAHEVATLLALMEAALRDDLPRLAEAGVRLTFFGELERLPQSFQRLIGRCGVR